MSTQETPELKPICLTRENGPIAAEIHLVMAAITMLTEAPPPTKILDDYKLRTAWLNHYRGRAPVMLDLNNQVVVMETTTLISYLWTRYDKEYKISFCESSQSYGHARQLAGFHTSCMARAMFVKELEKKFGPPKDCIYFDVFEDLEALDARLSGTKVTDGRWLVGGKMSYVDLLFYAWVTLVNSLGAPALIWVYPSIGEWYGQMSAIHWVQNVMEKCGAVLAPDYGFYFANDDRMFKGGPNPEYGLPLPNDSENNGTSESGLNPELEGALPNEDSQSNEPFDSRLNPELDCALPDDNSSHGTLDGGLDSFLAGLNENDLADLNDILNFESGVEPAQTS